MTLSRRIAEHVVSVGYADVPAEAMAVAKLSLLDAIGVTLAASGLGEGCQAFVDLALEPGGRAESTIIGYGAKAPMLMAALANGAMAHAMDFEDAYEKSPMHPNAQLVPALLALAEAQGASGRDLLTAIAVGCDLVCRLGLSLTKDPADFGWYTPPVLGTIGAAAACARLMGLNADQVLDAISLAIGPAGSSAEVKYSPQSTVRAVRDAFSAHAGLLAARLAAKGVKGFDRPLEGKAGLFALYAGGGFDPDVLTAGLGGAFEGEHVSFKPWPSCRGTHPFIEAALDLRAAHSLKPDDIAVMTMTGGRLQSMLFDPPEIRLTPNNAIQAKFSGPYTTALALIRGAVTLDEFSADSLSDPAILALAARTAPYRLAPGAAADNPTAGTLSLTLRSGAVLTRTIDMPLGHPTKPIAYPAMVAKFRDCARYAAAPLPTAALDALVHAIDTLQDAPDAGRALFPTLTEDRR
jgi:2-methylcitrate dehydratase PrpD